jgi:hypothetical protein
MNVHHQPGPGRMLVLGCLITLLVVMATGCSGINASKSISPLDFILPGLMQNDAPLPLSPMATNSVARLATRPALFRHPGGHAL